MARPVFHPLPVAAVDPLTDDAVAVTFAVPPPLAPEFAFAPGQSLTVRRHVDGVEHRRSYSICAPVGAAPRIGVREVAGGAVSRWLVRDVRAGDVVEVLPPSGRFRADPAVPARHLCLAAGSGITPLLSIAASALAHPESEVALVYANRTSASVMFADELGDLKNRHPSRLQVLHVLSREPRDVELLSGRLDADRLRRLLTTAVPVADADHVWLCGPWQLVEVARAVLADLGVPAERVHAELFHVGDEAPPPLRRPRPAPSGTRTVTAVLDGVAATSVVAPGQSVLDAVATQRADVPFACRGGVCGTCRARVVDGEVDLRRRHALEDDEVAAGFVLTCQSYPLTPTTTVDYDA